MGDEWVVEETADVDLKDARLNARLRRVLEDLARRPTASLPAASGGHAEVTAAYRFFDNDKAVPEEILAGHIAATRRRIAAQPTVLLANDTTEMDLTRPEQQVVGAGPLDGGARRGVQAHVLAAFTPDGTPLGALEARVWTRAEETVCASQTRAERAATPIEQKESFRWIEALRRAAAEAERGPTTRLIYLADSEADIHALFVEAQEVQEVKGLHWIVRACQDRGVWAGPEGPGRLKAWARSQPVLFTQEISVRDRRSKVACEQRGRRRPRESRRAQVEVRAGRVTLQPPASARGTPTPVTVNGVLVREIAPPPNEEPVEWLLLTSLPLDSEAAVREVIAFYCVRWMIELFFRVLKSGCRVEQRRFEHIDRFLVCLAVYLIVAWRTLYVCRLSRSCPDIDGEAVFEPAEWRAAWKVVRRSDPPPRHPALGEMVQIVARLGGYLPRKNSPPGPQTVWLGLQRVHDFALCWNCFGPGREQEDGLV